MGFETTTQPADQPTDAEYVVQLSGPDQPFEIAGETDLYLSAGISQSTYTTPETGLVVCDEVILYHTSITVEMGLTSFSIGVPGDSLREGTFSPRRPPITATGCTDRNLAKTFTASFYDQAKPGEIYLLRSGQLEISKDEGGEFVGTLIGALRFASTSGGPVTDEGSKPWVDVDASFTVSPDAPVEIIPGPVLGTES